MWRITVIKLYRLRDRLVREIADDDALSLRCLKRAGFVVGKLPPLPKAKQPKVEEPIAPTEGEEIDSAEERKPVLATHAPITATVPDVEIEVVVEPPLSEMSMKELRVIAKENKITVPFDVRKKVDIAAYLAEKLEGSK